MNWYQAGLPERLSLKTSWRGFPRVFPPQYTASFSLLLRWHPAYHMCRSPWMKAWVVRGYRRIAIWFMFFTNQMVGLIGWGLHSPRVAGKGRNKILSQGHSGTSGHSGRGSTTKGNISQPPTDHAPPPASWGVAQRVLTAPHYPTPPLETVSEPTRSVRQAVTQTCPRSSLREVDQQSSAWETRVLAPPPRGWHLEEMAKVLSVQRSPGQPCGSPSLSPSLCGSLSLPLYCPSFLLLNSDFTFLFFLSPLSVLSLTGCIMERAGQLRRPGFKFCLYYFLATWLWISYLSESPCPCLKSGGIPMLPTLLRWEEQNEANYMAHSNSLAKAGCYTPTIKLRRFCVAHHSFIHESSQIPMMCQALCLLLKLKRWVVKADPHSQDPRDRSRSRHRESCDASRPSLSPLWGGCLCLPEKPPDSWRGHGRAWHTGAQRVVIPCLFSPSTASFSPFCPCTLISCPSSLPFLSPTFSDFLSPPAFFPHFFSTSCPDFLPWPLLFPTGNPSEVLVPWELVLLLKGSWARMVGVSLGSWRVSTRCSPCGSCCSPSPAGGGCSPSRRPCWSRPPGASCSIPPLRADLRCSGSPWPCLPVVPPSHLGFHPPVG